MLLRRYPLLFLLLALIGSIFVSWPKRSEFLGGTPQSAVAKSVVSARSIERTFPNSLMETTEVNSSVEPVASVGEPIALDAEASLMLSEEIAWRTAGSAAGLELTDAQWRAFAETAILHQAIRCAYEAEIANVTMVNDTLSRVTIPCYAEEGESLRDEFFLALKEVLGGEAAMQVFRRLGRDLDARFGGFGVAVQTLELSLENDGGASAVTRTAHYWNSDEERAVVRREIHWPQLEDPYGDAWGPLIARVEQFIGRRARG